MDSNEVPYECCVQLTLSSYRLVVTTGSHIASLNFTLTLLFQRTNLVTLRVGVMILRVGSQVGSLEEEYCQVKLRCEV